MEEKQFLARLLNGIARHFDFNDEISFENRNVFLYELKGKNEQLFNDLNQLINTYMVYDFVKSDKEMKIKMPDMWEKEKEECKSQWESTKEGILGLLDKYGIGF